MNRPGVRQVPEGSGEQGKMEETGCKIICGAPTTLAVKGLMMMMMMMPVLRTCRKNVALSCAILNLTQITVDIIDNTQPITAMDKLGTHRPSQDRAICG